MCFSEENVQCCAILHIRAVHAYVFMHMYTVIKMDDYGVELGFAARYHCYFVIVNVL